MFRVSLFNPTQEPHPMVNERWRSQVSESKAVVVGEAKKTVDEVTSVRGPLRRRICWIVVLNQVIAPLRDRKLLPV